MRNVAIVWAATTLLTAAASVGGGAWASGKGPGELLDDISLCFGIGITGPDGARLTVAENRLRGVIERAGLMIRDSSPYQLRGKAEVVDEEEVSGGFGGSNHVVKLELNLFLQDTRDGQVLGSASFAAKGMGATQEEALKKAVKNLKFAEDDIFALRDSALERLAIILDEECTKYYDEGKRLYGQGKYREALVPLSMVVAGATVYQQAQKLKSEIRMALWRREENRIREAQARAKEDQERRLRAFYRAREAEANAQAKRDSLEAARERGRMNKHELRRLEERAKLAEQEKQRAYAELMKEVHAYKQAVAGLDRAMESVRPAAAADLSGSGWMPKVRSMSDRIAGTWELVKEESVIQKCRVEAQTISLDPSGQVTVWLINDGNAILVGKGSFTSSGHIVTINIDEPDVSECLGGAYQVLMRGESRMYIVGENGDRMAFCKVGS